MKENERCSNCKKYPFCNRCEKPTGWCENWTKRKIGDNQCEKGEYKNI